MFKRTNVNGLVISLTFFFLSISNNSIAGYSPERIIDSLSTLLKNAKGDAKSEYLYEIGRVYFNFGDLDKPGQARSYAEKLASYAKSSGDRYPEALSIVLFAGFKSDEEKYDEALQLYKKALAIFNSIPSRDFVKDIKIAQTYLYMSNAYQRKFNVSKAVDCLQKTIEISEKTHEKIMTLFKKAMKKNGEDPGKELSVREALDYMKKFPKDTEARQLGFYAGEVLSSLRGSYLHLGNLFKDVKDYNNALFYLKKGQKIAEEVGAKESRLKILGSIAETFKEQQLYDSSIVYLKWSHSLAKGFQNLRYMYFISSELAMVYSEKGDLVNALACYEYNDKLLEPVKDGSYKNIEMYNVIKNDEEGIKLFFLEMWAGVRVKMGDIYMKSDSLKAKGIEYYKSALAVWDSLVPLVAERKDYDALAEFNHELGSLYIKLNNYSKGIALINKSLVRYNANNDKENVLNCYHLLSEAYEKNNDFKNAGLFYKKFIELKDSLFSLKNSMAMANFQKRIEVETRDNKIDLLNKGKKAQQAEIARQKFQRNATFGGLALVGLLTMVIARSLYLNKKKNKLITEQKHFIEEKNKEITDSINYAKRIQQAILPPPELLDSMLPENFILYQPKDVVSGDFYGIVPLGDEVIVVTADCTGHGVPGALMSMIGNEQLTKIILEKEITRPAAILDALHAGMRKALKQDRSEGETRDGMDLALYKLNFKTKALEYAGANRPLWIVRKGEIQEIKADKQPIGGLQTDTRKPFTNHSISLESGDTLFTFTDGFADQFGGDKGKKFMLKNFERLLQRIHNRSLKDQYSVMLNEFEQWKGNHEQVDDVLVIGIRV